MFDGSLKARPDPNSLLPPTYPQDGVYRLIKWVSSVITKNSVFE